MFLKKFLIFFLLSVTLFSFSCSQKKKGFQHFNNNNTKIALVLSGPSNDSLWNLAAYRGLKRFQGDYRVNISVVEKVSLADATAVFSELASRKYDLILGHGYEFGFILKKIALKYPQTFFCVIGGEISQEPNLCSYNFKDEQYGYLIGVVLGLNTATNRVGVVIGKKVPTIEKALIGIRKGLKSINPKADLIVSYINSWDDIAKGKEAATNQINAGADVITHIADTGGIGVIKAAEEADISAVGAIVDQHDLAPSTVITSGIEDASQLVYLACESYIEQSIEPIVYRFGLKDQVVDISPFYGNSDPTTEATINRVKNNLIDLETAQQETIEGLKRNRGRN